MSNFYENRMLLRLNEQGELALGPAADAVREIRDIDLGWRSGLLARSAYCLTFSAIIPIREEHAATRA